MADPAYIVDGVLTDGEAWVGIQTHDQSGLAVNQTFVSTGYRDFGHLDIDR